MKKSTKDAIESIVKAGFSYIKVELEGDLGRGRDSSECDDCWGSGGHECEDCSGSGAVESGQTVGISQTSVYEECDNCYGEGHQTCYTCDGSGEVDGFSSEDVCQDYLYANVSEEARRKIIYGRFYEDGSVDSEFTFTVHIRDADTIIEWINAFNSLAYEINGDGEIDVDGAGMHISVLPTSCEGSYPCHRPLDYEGMNNFAAQMRKLMPALYFLATPDWRSRPLEYRYPRVSNDDKFSAIYTHGNTCLEYRVFETCYDNPEKMFDNIEVIAKTLEFYSDKEKTVQSNRKDFFFYERGSIAHMFETPEALRLLNKQLKHLKPKNRTLKELKTERNVPVTIKETVAQHRSRVEALRSDYERIKAINDNLRQQPLTDVEKEQIDHQMSYWGQSHREALASVRGIRNMPRISSFIRQQLHEGSTYTLTV